MSLLLRSVLDLLSPGTKNIWLKVELRNLTSI